MNYKIICISNRFEYLDREQSYKNSTREVMILGNLSYHSNLSTKYLTNFRFKGTVKIDIANWKISYNRKSGLLTFFENLYIATHLQFLNI